MFRIVFFCLCFWRLDGVRDKQELKFMMEEDSFKFMLEGESLTISSDLTEIKDDDVIQWIYGDFRTETLIAEINVTADRIAVYDDVLDGRFRDRLKLNKHTGSLTVINITEEIGYYSPQINGLRKRTIKIGAYEPVTLTSATKGESVTLNSGLTEIKDDDVIQWMLDDDKNEILIAEINVTADRIAVYDDVLDGRFRDRLKLNKHTGSLTITNITTEHAGYYKRYAQQIKSKWGSDSEVLLSVFVEISVMEGESLTINSDITEIKRYEWIRWIFGDENILIAEIDGDRIAVYDDYLGRFRDRLKLNNQTGSLTITNITTEQAGDYKLIHRKEDWSSIWFSGKAFRVSVSARLPVPAINRDCSSSSSSSSSPPSCWHLLYAYFHVAYILVTPFYNVNLISIN
ncbi:uncharacterized protein LOC120478192 [Pimephales promelas]|uniref:uncharacterized protein LOC120478192 n=1 Tax=Pimephales promelas TaxID=90988 RepID=UPI001955A92A|nr:uncharacterized protein LOC120478192 [Pimephales promelas]